VRFVIVAILGLGAMPAYAAAPMGQPLDESALSGEVASQMKSYDGLVSTPPKLAPPEAQSCAGAPAEAGTVRLRMQVQKDGKIGQIMVMETSGSSTLGRDAAAYVKARWRFEPASVAGMPVPAWLTTRLAFNGEPASCPTPAAASPPPAGPIE
jgi:TonB family protein